MPVRCEAGPRTGPRPGTRYRAPDWRPAPRNHWPSPGCFETSSGPVVWSRETSRAPENRYAARQPAPPEYWRSRSCCPPAGIRVDASMAGVKSAAGHGIFAENDDVRKPRDSRPPVADDHGSNERQPGRTAMTSGLATRTYGTVSAERRKEMSGLEFVKGLADGSLPLNTI